MFSTSLPSLKLALVVFSYGRKPSYRVPFSVGPEPEMSSRKGITVSLRTSWASQRPSRLSPASARALPENSTASVAALSMFFMMHTSLLSCMDFIQLSFRSRRWLARA